MLLFTCTIGGPRESRADQPVVPAGFQPADERSPSDTPPKLLQPAEVLPAPIPPADGPELAPGPRSPLLPEETSIGSIGVSIAPKEGRLPQNIALEQFREQIDPHEVRPWMGQVYHWDAPALCYGPLRYEEVNLERYGYTHCPLLQPAKSAVHFLASTAALPYSMALHPCWECNYPLGHYRPGSPVPYQAHWAPLRPLPSAAQVGAIAGLILLIP
jgi:hypothetical protein